MPELKPFRTGMICSFIRNKIPPLPYKGKGWHIKFEKPHPKDLRGIATHVGEDKVLNKEVIIYAKDFEQAWFAAELIHDCLAIINPDHVCITQGYQSMFGMSDDTVMVVPKRVKDIKELKIDIYGAITDHEGRPYELNYPNTLHCQGIVAASYLAARVTHRKANLYAVIKLATSINLINLPMVDISPFTATGILPKIGNPKLQVKAAYAIVLAYSSIEEMKLEVRASSSNPSLIRGMWNPSVKQNLEERLTKAGINLQEKIIWMLRGGKTLLETRRPIGGARTKWSRGPFRDKNVEIIDAINYSNWLRNTVAAHKFNKLITKISAYDVLNIQFLARRLLLKKYKLWLNNYDY